MKKYLQIIILIAILIGGYPESAHSQCPMCKQTVESSLQDKSSTKGLGLNDGIIYLFAFPFIVLGTIGGVWYFNARRKLD